MDDATLTLVDVNPKMIAAWQAVFAGEAGVRIRQGSLLDEHVDAWVTPTNARAIMNGGVDALVRRHLGPGIQARVRRAVTSRWGDAMPLGTAVCTATGRRYPSYLIAAPTMRGPSDDISATMHVALACAAALHCVRVQNTMAPASIRSVAMPGLGAGTGRVPPALCAELMYTAWKLFEAHPIHDFGDLRTALEHELGDLGDDLDGPPDPTPPPTVHRVPRPAVLPVPFHGYRLSA